MQNLYARLKQQFPLGEFHVQRPDLAFLTVERVRLRPLLRFLRDAEGFTHLVLLTAVDWIEDNRFQLTYLVHNRKLARDIGLRVMIPRDDPEMDGIHDIWPTAATYQRELKEMFGIDFPGSPRIDEEFILEGWIDMPPYRRDFDTKKYSDETYEHRAGRATTDPATYMKQRLYPEASSK